MDKLRTGLRDGYPPRSNLSHSSNWESMTNLTIISNNAARLKSTSNLAMDTNGCIGPNNLFTDLYYFHDFINFQCQFQVHDTVPGIAAPMPDGIIPFLLAARTTGNRTSHRSNDFLRQADSISTSRPWKGRRRRLNYFDLNIRFRYCLIRQQDHVTWFPMLFSDVM